MQIIHAKSIVGRLLTCACLVAVLAACGSSATVTPAPSNTPPPTATAAAVETPAARSSLAWHREGGIAGFCDDLVIVPDGTTVAFSCKGGERRSLGRLVLYAEQMELLEGWLSRFEPVEWTQTDAATAGAMTIRVLVSGRGTGQPTADEKLEIERFASALFAMLDIGVQDR